VKFEPAPEQSAGKLEKDIMEKFQMVDQTLDNCENLVGKWQANNKFLSLCSHLDLICDKVETLNYQTMDAIGNPAKELNKDLEEVLKILRQM
jgi:hypothetical protein